MDGVGPGTLIAGRYELRRPLSTRESGTRWVGHDTTFDRDVTLLLVPRDDAARAADVLDAARRCAVVDNPRLVRIYDIGQDERWAWVVEEDSSGARTLADVLSEGPLPAEEVRRITGEVAAGLDAGTGRGLHHRRLTPACVLLSPQGAVKVSGLGTDAALAGADDGDDGERRDAVGVVALAYAGLTGAWPLSGDTAGLPRAMTLAGDLVRPSEVVGGVPGDLDALCRLTLSEDAGPVSPGDYAAQIAPWSPIPVQRTSSRLSTAAAPATGGSTAPEAAPGTTAAERTSAGPTDDTSVLPSAPARPTPPQRPEAVSADEQPTVVRQRVATAAGAAERAAKQAAATGSAAATTGSVDAARTGSGATTAASAAAGASAARARLAGLARNVGARATDVATDRRARKEAVSQSEERKRVGIRQTEVQDTYESPAPFLPASAGGPPSRQQTAAVLAGLVVLTLALCSLGIFGSLNSGQDVAFPALPGADTSTQPLGPRIPDDKTGSDRQVAFDSVVGYDPLGDGTEHNADTSKAWDEDKATAWTTEGYQAPISQVKQGVGLAIDLGSKTTLGKAVLDLPQAANVEVYAAQKPQKDGAKLVGGSKGRAGKVTLTAPAGTTGRYVIVWFTDGSRSSDGAYRATLTEIALYSA